MKVFLPLKVIFLLFIIFFYNNRIYYYYHYLISLELESQLENKEEVIATEFDIGRRFSLTESNFPTQQISNRDVNTVKEKNENNNTKNTIPLTSSPTSSSTLSPTAEKFLNSLPDLTFMLVTPYVENGKE